MPPSAAEVVVDTVTARSKFTWRAASAAAAKYGLNAIVCCAAAWLIWGQHVKQVERGEAEAEASSLFIREQLLKLNENQAKVIAQNGEQLKQNSEVMRANQECLEACTESHREVVKALERLAK